jgi:hypothetical protein
VELSGAGRQQWEVPQRSGHAEDERRRDGRVSNDSTRPTSTRPSALG